MSKGSLYLIPSLMGGQDSSIIPDAVKSLVQRLDVYIVENAKSARHFMRQIGFKGHFDQIEMLELNKRTDPTEMYHFLDACEEGRDIGLISEAGAPAIADPGAEIVSLAHIKGIRVHPMTGPSSIILALMASGLNGQQFTFHGYLPIDSKARQHKLKQLEQQSAAWRQSQIFMEAPYRNKALLADILKVCHADTKLCIAANLTLGNEFIRTRSIAEWKRQTPELHKKPAIFILLKF